MLTPKKRLFAKEYIVDLNGTQAAIRAGYSTKTASSQAERLLRDVDVQAAVHQAVQARERRAEVTADRVVTELAKLGFASMLDYITVQPDGTAVVSLSTLTREQAAAIQEITVEEYTDGKAGEARPVKRVRLKLVDKKGSLELLGRHLGIFKEQFGPVVNVNIAHEHALAELE